MPNQPASPRRFRLQFSLRSVLLLMVVASVAFTIYRWPWEEVTDDSRSGRVVTTFRRRALGVPIKSRDGPEKFYHRNDDGTEYLQTITMYADGMLVGRSLLNERGETIVRVHERDARWHGPIFDTRYYKHESGQCADGKKVGKWKCVYDWQGEEVRVSQQFDADLAHGKWTWKAANDKVLQSAEFDHGKLITWNGMPAANAIREWKLRCEMGVLTYELLASPIHQVQLKQMNGENWWDGGATIEFPLESRTERIVVHFEDADIGQFRHDLLDFHLAEKRDIPFLAGLIEHCLTESRMPVYRFGVLCIVPIADCELNWRNRSGTTDVRFERGSSQELAWKESVVEDLPLDLQDVEWRFQSLFAGTSIQIDATEFRPVSGRSQPDLEFHRSLLFNFYKSPPTQKRSRRDILGLILYDRNWSCEQRGSVLILHPYPAEEK